MDTDYTYTSEAVQKCAANPPKLFNGEPFPEHLKAEWSKLVLDKQLANYGAATTIFKYHLKKLGMLPLPVTPGPVWTEQDEKDWNAAELYQAPKPPTVEEVAKGLDVTPTTAKVLVEAEQIHHAAKAVLGFKVGDKVEQKDSLAASPLIGKVIDLDEENQCVQIEWSNGNYGVISADNLYLIKSTTAVPVNWALALLIDEGKTSPTAPAINWAKVISAPAIDWAAIAAKLEPAPAPAIDWAKIAVGLKMAPKPTLFDEPTFDEPKQKHAYGTQNLTVPPKSKWSYLIPNPHHPSGYHVGQPIDYHGKAGTVDYLKPDGTVVVKFPDGFMVTFAPAQQVMLKPATNPTAVAIPTVVAVQIDKYIKAQILAANTLAAAKAINTSGWSAAWKAVLTKKIKVLAKLEKEHATSQTFVAQYAAEAAKWNVNEPVVVKPVPPYTPPKPTQSAPNLHQGGGLKGTRIE